MSVYVGIDVHRERSQVEVVTEDGQVQRQVTYPRTTRRAPGNLSPSVTDGPKRTPDWTSA
jgi:hypothetical protein